MRLPEVNNVAVLGEPMLIKRAGELAAYAGSLTVYEIEKTMRVSGKLAGVTHELLQEWTTNPLRQRAAVDSFLGDVYSGLQILGWSAQDRLYANAHLRILSGLYGILRPLDGVYPYRLEMGYKLPGVHYHNLYRFWGKSITDTLPEIGIIVDLSAVEYGKVVTKYVAPDRVITPRFMTISSNTGEPVFVVVHAKIARGAFASWMIRNKIETVERLKEFHDIGYVYHVSMSTNNVPVFICSEFKGLGLSVRLS